LDHEKEPRFAVCYDSEDEQGEYDTETELYRFADGDWGLVSSSKTDGRMLTVEGTALDGRVYAWQRENRGTRAFGTLDTATGAFEELFHDPESDPSQLIY